MELVNNPENHPLPKPVEVLISPGQKDLVQIFLKVILPLSFERVILTISACTINLTEV